MKARNIKAVLIFSLVFGLISVLGAQNRHQDKDDHRRSTRKEYRSDRDHKHYKKDKHNKHSHNYHHNRDNYKHQQKRHHQHAQTHHCHHGCKGKHCSHNSHVHRHRSNYETHHKPYGNSSRYLQRLPSHRYLSFKIGYDTFYHCKGSFYNYVPNRGYTNVQLRLTSVNYIPRHHTYREVNGNSYYYCDGYYYIPHKHGYYRIYNSHEERLSCRVY